MDNINDNGGLNILNSYGAQDIYLKSKGFENLDNQLFFNETINRHEEFGMGLIKNDDLLNNNSEEKTSVVKLLAKRQREIIYTVPRAGDILESTFIKVSLKALPDGYYYKNMLMYNIFEFISMEIGGQKINTLYNNMMYINDLINNDVPEHSRYMHISNNIDDLIEWSKEDFELYIPVNIPISTLNNHIPIISLTLHDVKFIALIKNLSSIVENSNSNSNSNSKIDDDKVTDILDEVSIEVYHNFIYLSTEYRRHLGNSDYSKHTQKVYNGSDNNNIKYTGMEMLMKQTQFTGANIFNGNKLNTRLDFNHPVSCFYFIITDKFNNIVSDLKFDLLIKLNGHKDISENSNYFNKYLPRKYLKLKNGFPDGIYFYNYCLNPLDSKPSGSLNFSRINIATLDVNITNFKDNGTELFMHIYANNYQVMRIMSGMAGLAYSK